MARPAFLGAISSTSRSPVGREKPYTMVTTNPPIQSRRISSCTAESNSRRNDSHGSGMPLFTCVGKVFSLHVGQEIPVRCGGRAMLSQPYSLSLGHRVVAEGIFVHKPRALQDFQMLSKLSRPLHIVLAFRHVARHADSESQSVLPITHLGVSDEPAPVHFKVGHGQPWQSLGNAGGRQITAERNQVPLKRFDAYSSFSLTR
jgi:hypothetical protein